MIFVKKQRTFVTLLVAHAILWSLALLPYLVIGKRSNYSLPFLFGTMLRELSPWRAALEPSDALSASSHGHRTLFLIQAAILISSMLLVSFPKKDAHKRSQTTSISWGVIALTSFSYLGVSPFLFPFSLFILPSLLVLMIVGLYVVFEILRTLIGYDRRQFDWSGLLIGFALLALSIPTLIVLDWVNVISVGGA